MALSALFVLLAASAAQAATQDPNDLGQFLCRASAVRTQALGLERVEPAVANGNPFNANPDHTSCVDDSATLTGQNAGIKVNTAVAATSIDPDQRPSKNQKIAAVSRVEDLEIGGPDGIVLTAATAEGTASCAGPGSLTSSVGMLSIGGTQVLGLDPIAEGVKTITTPLGAVIRVEVNRTITETSPNGKDVNFTRRALEITVLEGTSPFGLANVVVGEVKLGVHNNPCLDEPPNANGGPPIGDPNCKPGFVLDPIESRQCVKVITVDGPCVLPAFVLNGTCIRLERETGGGFLVPLSAISGPCRTAKLDTKVAIVGTNGPDRITGTNFDDRILGLGGRDRIDGGRRNDCEDGGTGNDVLDGANDNDLLFGMSGKDILNGGSGRDRLSGASGNDKLSGGSGNDRLDGGKGKDRIFGDAGNDRAKGGSGRDYMNTGNGRDTVSGGPGFDAINAATSGPAAKINCGSGGGSARINPNELKRVKRCKPVRLDRRRRGITGRGQGH